MPQTSPIYSGEPMQLPKPGEFPLPAGLSNWAGDLCDRNGDQSTEAAGERTLDSAQMLLAALLDNSDVIDALLERADPCVYATDNFFATGGDVDRLFHDLRDVLDVGRA